MGKGITHSVNGGSGAALGVAAPNVLVSGTSVSIAYQWFANDTEFTFNGTVALPTSDPAYAAHFKRLIINAVSPAGQRIQIGNYTSFSGASLTFVGVGDTSMVLTGAPQSWGVEFEPYNEVGTPTASPTTVSVSVPAAVVTSITGAQETPSTRTNDPVTKLNFCYPSFVPVLGNNIVPQNVTFLKSRDGGNNWIGVGWQPVTAVGQALSWQDVAPVATSTWGIAALAGAVDVDPYNAIPTSQLPASAVTATFTIQGLSLPSASLLSALTIAAGAGGSFPYNAKTSDGTQYYSIPSISYNDTPCEGDINAFFVRITTQDLDGSHNSVGPEQQFSGYNVSQSGAAQTAGPLIGAYGTDGYSYTRTGNIAFVRFRVYVCNRADGTATAFSNPAASVLQTGIGSGAGYIDVLVASAGALPAGAVATSRLASGALPSGVTAPAAQVTGSLTASQIGSVTASTITGTIAAGQIGSLTASQITGTLLAGQIGSITAGQITGTISSSQISTISASQINGTISAGQISAVSASSITGVIVTSQLESQILNTVSLFSQGIFGPGLVNNGTAIAQDTTNTANIANNPDFTYGTKDWYVYPGVTASTTVYHSGGASLKVVGVNQGVINSIVSGPNNGMYTCKPGDQFILSSYVMAAPGATGYANNLIRFVDVNGTDISDGPWGTVQASAAINTWQLMQTGISTAPANAAYVQIFAIWTGGSSNSTWYVDNVVMQYAVNQNMISSVSASTVTGTLNAAQISTVNTGSFVGLIVAGQIQNLTTSQLTGMISASNISGTLTASQITSVFATSLSGTITASQIASVFSSTLSGPISSSLITNVNASAISGVIVAGQINTVSATSITGSITASQIGSVNVTSLTINGGVNVGNSGITFVGTGGIYLDNSNGVRESMYIDGVGFHFTASVFCSQILVNSFSCGGGGSFVGGVTAAGFNPVYGGIQYFGATGSLTVSTPGGGSATIQVYGGAVTSL